MLPRIPTVSVYYPYTTRLLLIYSLGRFDTALTTTPLVYHILTNPYFPGN